jgi:hypothetical protein
MHVHILGLLAGLGGVSTYLGPLFRRRRRRRRLLCDLVMVYITIDDLVLDHLSDSGYHPRLHSCHWPDRLL